MEALREKYLSLYLTAAEGSPDEGALLTIVSAFEQGGEDAIRWISLSRLATIDAIARGPLASVRDLSNELRVYDRFLGEVGVLV